MALSNADLLNLIASELPDNISESISPADLRDVLNNIVNSIYNKIDDRKFVGLSEWDSTKTYILNQGVVKNGDIYQCTANTSTTGTFVSSEWQVISTYIPSTAGLAIYAEKQNVIELDSNKLVKSITTDSSLTSIVSGIYKIEANSVPVGLTEEYPILGKAILFALRRTSTSESLYLCYPTTDLTKYYVKRGNSDWYEFKSAGADSTYSNGITKIGNDVQLGGNYSTIDLTGDTFDLTAHNKATISGTVGLAGRIIHDGLFKIGNNVSSISTDGSELTIKGDIKITDLPSELIGLNTKVICQDAFTKELYYVGINDVKAGTSFQAPQADNGLHFSSGKYKLGGAFTQPVTTLGIPYGGGTFNVNAAFINLDSQFAGMGLGALSMSAGHVNIGSVTSLNIVAPSAVNVSSYNINNTLLNQYNLTVPNLSIKASQYELTNAKFAASAGSVNINASGQMNIRSGAPMSIKSDAPMKFWTNSAPITFNAGGAPIQFSTEAPFAATAGGGFTFDAAAPIRFNTPAPIFMKAQSSLFIEGGAFGGSAPVYITANNAPVLVTAPYNLRYADDSGYDDMYGNNDHKIIPHKGWVRDYVGTAGVAVGNGLIRRDSGEVGLGGEINQRTQIHLSSAFPVNSSFSITDSWYKDVIYAGDGNFGTTGLFIDHDGFHQNVELTGLQTTGNQNKRGFAVFQGGVMLGTIHPDYRNQSLNQRLINGLYIDDSLGMHCYKYNSVETINFAYKQGWGNLGAYDLSLDWGNYKLYSTSGDGGNPAYLALDWGDRVLKDSNAVTSLNWNNRILKDSFGYTVVDWDNSKLAIGSGYSVDWSFCELAVDGNVRVNWSNMEMYDNDGNLSINWNSKETFNSSNQTTIDWENGQLYNQGGNVSVDWEGHILNDYDGNPSADATNRMLYANNSPYSWSVNWDNRILHSNFNNYTSLDWENRKLYGSDGVTNAVDWSSGEVVLPTAGAITVPVGTTGDRPSSPTNGMIRFNATTSKYEGYVEGTGWVDFH